MSMLFGRNEGDNLKQSQVQFRVYVYYVYTHAPFHTANRKINVELSLKNTKDFKF